MLRTIAGQLPRTATPRLMQINVDFTCRREDAPSGG
jgi:hypothetical protein